MFTTSADGYTLTVTADRLSVPAGGDVTFTATFENGTDQPIDYAPVGCSGAAAGVVHVPMPSPEGGRRWTGIQARFKRYVLEQGMGPGIVPAFQPLLAPMRGDGCDVTAISKTLAPGGSVTNTLTWRALLATGVDAIGGPAAFAVSVGYGQQNVAPSQPVEGPGISWTPMFKQLTIDGSIEVESGDQVLARPGEIVDALLSDRTFAGWLTKRPSSTWSNSNIFLMSMPKAQGIVPKGPSWEIDLFRETGVPRHWAIGFVDPFDATVRSVAYCDIPCNR